MDLSSLQSITLFLQEIESRNTAAVALVNNAGMIVLQSMKINHLGHFALTLGLTYALYRGSLLPTVGSVEGVNVVNVASVEHVEGSAHIAEWVMKAREQAQLQSKSQ